MKKARLFGTNNPDKCSTTKQTSYTETLIETLHMQITLLKGKLHMASVTQAELWYDGSCAIDKDLVELAGFREFEQIDIYNVDNGERFHTYVILAESGSGTISMNGAAARRVQVGDRVIIAAYGQMNEAQADEFKPKLVYLNKDNSVERTTNTIPVQKD